MMDRWELIFRHLRREELLYEFKARGVSAPLQAPIAELIEILRAKQQEPISLAAFDIGQLCNSKGDAVKESYAALLSLLIEAARHDTDADTLSVTLLQDYNFTTVRNDKLIKVYRQYKTKLQAALSHIGIHPPHITDAKWRLDYCIKASSLEQVGSFLYLIQLHTESCTEELKTSENGGVVNKLKFSCTQEELQDLVWKLRDTVRHVEKIANA